MPSVERHLTQSAFSTRRSQRIRVCLKASASAVASTGGVAEASELMIYNLSRDGFLIDARPDWPVGAGLRIVLPDVGTVEARIARAEPDLFGCTFAAPLSPAELDRCTAASTVVWPDFVRPPGQADRGTSRRSGIADRQSGLAEGSGDEPERWPRPLRTAIAVGGGLLLWGMIALAVF